MCFSDRSQADSYGNTSTAKAAPPISGFDFDGFNYITPGAAALPLGLEAHSPFNVYSYGLLSTDAGIKTPTIRVSDSKSRTFKPKSFYGGCTLVGLGQTNVQPPTVACKITMTCIKADGGTASDTLAFSGNGILDAPLQQRVVDQAAAANACKALTFTTTVALFDKLTVLAKVLGLPIAEVSSRVSGLVVATFLDDIVLTETVPGAAACPSA